jgi:hypothetical protein
VTISIHVGDALACLRAMPGESVHCCVTSPPYWGLRDYGTPPQVWEGDGIHDWPHEWESEVVQPRHSDDGISRSTLLGGKQTQAQTQRQPVVHAHCRYCGAWRGSLGLEPTYQQTLATFVTLASIRLVLRRLARAEGLELNKRSLRDTLLRWRAGRAVYRCSFRGGRMSSCGRYWRSGSASKSLTS